MSGTAKAQDIIIKLCLAAAILFMVWAGFQYITLSPNTDISWLLYAARKVLEGKTLYIDLAETNPPLIVWYNQLAVFLSPAPTSDLLVYHKLVLAACFISITMSAIIADKAGFLTRKNDLAFIFILLAVAIILAGNYEIFSQREHLLVIFLLPYLTYSVPAIFSRYFPSRLAVFTIAAWASLGILLKPYFLIPYLLVEIFYLVKLRRLDPVRFSIGFIIFIFGALYLFAAFYYENAYFTEILPDLLRTYSDHRLAGGFIVDKFYKEMVPLLAIAPLLFINWKTIKTPEIVYSFVLIVASAGLIFSQYKGWDYNYYPLACSIYIFICFCLARLGAFKSNTTVKYKILLLIPTASVAFLAASYQSRYSLEPVIWLVYAAIFFTSISLIIEIAAFKKLSWRDYVYFPVQSAVILFFINQYSPQLFQPITIAIISGCIGAVFARRFFKGKLKPATYRHHMLKLVCACLVIMLPTADFIRNKTDIPPGERWIMRGLTDKIKAENPKSIFVFSANFYPAFPLVQQINIEWASRYHHLWMMPAMYAGKSCKAKPEFADIEARMLQNLAIDFNKYKPDLLVFDASTVTFLLDRGKYDYYQCVKEYPPLAKILDHYRYASKMMRCHEGRRVNCNFIIYKKIENY